jgi:hypothetical protein
MPLSTIFQLNMWRSVLFVEETGVPGENDRPVANQLNCLLVTKNIDVFAPSPPFFWQKFYLITVSVHGTLLYFTSLISDKISHT